MKRFCLAVSLLLGGVLPASAQTCNRTAVVSLPASIAATEIVSASAAIGGSQGQIIVCGFTLQAGDGLRSVTGTDPAAGVEISETVPTNARWNLLGVGFSFVTSATVANRVVNLVYDDGTNVYARMSAAVTQAAGLTDSYGAQANSPWSNSSALAYQIPLPSGVILSAGHRFKTSTQLLDAGDNYSAPQYLVQEYSVFKLVTGTGTNCATGQADATGVFTVRPLDTLTLPGTQTIATAPQASAVCISNLRPTTVTGVLSYGVR